MKLAMLALAATVAAQNYCTNAPKVNNGYSINVSSPSAFRSDALANSLSKNAVKPDGYNEMYKQQNASSENIPGYITYLLLPKYDPALCAAKCRNETACVSFNIYFERLPQQIPGPACPSPPPMQQVKCALYRHSLSSDKPTNSGQFQQQFEVAVVGSNAYSATPDPAIPGYGTPTILGDAAIEAPRNCLGESTYLGVATFTTGGFDATRCVKACDDKNVEEQGIARSNPAYRAKQCTFWNTYMVLKNGVAVRQECAMYTQPWGKEMATNRGQWDQDGAHYTLELSVTYANATNPGWPQCTCNCQCPGV